MRNFEIPHRDAEQNIMVVTTDLIMLKFSKFLTASFQMRMDTNTSHKYTIKETKITQ